MNEEQIKELLLITDEIIGYMETDKTDIAYHKATVALKPLQEFLLLLLEYGILEQDVVLMLLTDLVSSIEIKDDVLLLDTIKYGIYTLMQDILRVMEEE